jgi:hypothetical protein
VTAPDRHDLLWALVGALTFLVLIQGYELLFGERIAVEIKVGVALGVGVASTLLTRWLERRMAA